MPSSSRADAFSTGGLKRTTRYGSRFTRPTGALGNEPLSQGVTSVRSADRVTPVSPPPPPGGGSGVSARQSPSRADSGSARCHRPRAESPGGEEEPPGPSPATLFQGGRG